MAQTKKHRSLATAPSSSPSKEHVEEQQQLTHIKTKPSPAKSGTKRAAATDETRSEKKMKPSDNAPSADEKKPVTQNKLFQRFWSEDDELAILKGMAEFLSKNGQNPYFYCEFFHSFVKDKLQVEATTLQLKEKIRRLKKKFENNTRRGKISNPHEQRVFELSKNVWGRENPKPEPNPKPNPKPKPKTKLKSKPKVETEMQLKKHVNGDVNSLYHEMSNFKELNEDELKRRLGLIEESKRKDLEKKWKDLRRAEIDLVAKRLQFISEQVLLLVEALTS